jgi:hypothetical protein
MRSVTYSMGVSLDGYIVGPDGVSTGRHPTKRSFASSPTRYDRPASTCWDGRIRGRLHVQTGAIFPCT